MATIKAYTDLSQSKTLSKILPHESADMYYWYADHYPKEDWIIEVGTPDDNYECICAWSLAALLSVLPDYTLQTNTDGTVFVVCDSKKPMISDAYDNPVDACYELILKLHELNLL